MLILLIVVLCVAALAVPYRSDDSDTSRLVHSSKLTYLDLSGNRIRSLDNSVFRKQGQLETLILSGNMLQSIGSDLFTDCTNLRSLHLSGNNITQISTSSFRGLERLEHLDLSNNNIQELSPLVFQNNLTCIQTRQAPGLKHLNLRQNKLHSFNFESFFPMSSDAEASTTTSQLENLDISSNCLYSVDAELVISLKRSKTHIDLTGNPWECECSRFGTWYKQQRRKTLPCELANHVTEDRCNVLESICPDIRAVSSTVRPDSDVGSTSAATVSTSVVTVSTSVVTVNISTQSTACIIVQGDKDTSLVTALFVVNGLLLVSIAGGVFVVVQLLKKMRKRSGVPEYDDIYVPLQGIGTTVRLDPSAGSTTYDEKTGHVYETVD
jgi:hypothetical protein